MSFVDQFRYDAFAFLNLLILLFSTGYHSFIDVKIRWKLSSVQNAMAQWCCCDLVLKSDIDVVYARHSSVMTFGEIPNFLRKINCLFARMATEFHHRESANRFQESNRFEQGISMVGEAWGWTGLCWFSWVRMVMADTPEWCWWSGLNWYGFRLPRAIFRFRRSYWPVDQ